MFRHVAMVMRLRKSQFRKPVRVPRAYNVSLYEVMDLDLHLYRSHFELSAITLMCQTGRERSATLHLYWSHWKVERIRRSSLGLRWNYRTTTGLKERSNLISMDPKNRYQQKDKRPRQVHRRVTHSTSRRNRPDVTAREGTRQFQSGSAVPIEPTQVAVAGGSTRMETEAHAQQPPTQGSNRDAVVPLQVTKATQTEPEVEVKEDIDAGIAMVRVRLLQTVRVPPRQSIFIKITIETELFDTPVVFEPSERTGQERWIYAEDCLMKPTSDGTIKVPFTNQIARTQIIQAGEMLCQVPSASVV